MRKRILVTLAVLILMSLYHPMAFSQSIMTEGFIDGDHRTNVGFNCSAFVPGSNKFKPGYYVGGQVSYDFYRWFALGVEGGYLESELKSSGVDVGKFQGGPVLADVLLKVPMDMNSFVFTPYGIAGFGALFSNVQSGDVITNNGRIETNATFLMKFGAGFDIILYDSVVINFEASYIYTKIDFNEKLTNQSFGLGSVDLNAGFVGGGVKYRF